MKSPLYKILNLKTFITLVLSVSLLLIACKSDSDKFDWSARPPNAKIPPESLTKAVELILSNLSDESKSQLIAMKREEVVKLNQTWGMGIRNDFELWGGNDSLLKECNTKDPDRASRVIMEAVWDQLHKVK